MIFLDTSFLVALEFEGDKNHGLAKEMSLGIFGHVYGDVFISDYVFDEILTLVLRKSKKLGIAIKVCEAMLNSFNLLMVTERTFHDALNRFRDQKGTKLSFTDCTSLALMDANRIKSMATFDKELGSSRNIKTVAP